MRRTTAVLIVVLVLVASAGPALAQSANNSTNTSGGATTIGGTGGSISNATGTNTTGNTSASVGASAGNASANGSVGTGVGAGTGAAASGASSSGSSGESAYGAGYLSDTMNNHSTNQNGSISFGNNSSSGGNATNNSSSSGLSSDADGVKGIAINAALDTFARVLKFISNQIASGLTFVLQHIVQAITWTSTPDMGDNFYHNPSNGIWEGMYSSYKQIWQPLALAAACLLTGLYVLNMKIEILPATVQQKGLLHLGIAWIAASDISWTLMGLMLNLADLLNRYLVNSISLENGFVGASSIALLALILVYLLGFWIVVFMMLVYGFRIVAVIALTPLMPAIFAARAIPIQGVSDIMDSLWRLWVYLVILPLPVGAVLAVGFGANMSNLMSGTGLEALGGAFFAMILQTGTLTAALVLPYILYQRSSVSSMGFGLAGSGTMDDLKERYQGQKDRIKETRENSRLTSASAPSSVHQMAVKANQVGILGRNTGRGGGGGGGGGGSAGGSGGKREVYVKSETRRKRLER